MIIIDEPETSLEQKRSYIKSHKLVQHPTTYKHHRHSDPIVLDSYEWVLLLKNGNINQCEDSFNSSINRFKINRCDRFYLYCSLFLCALVSSLFFILKRLFFVSVFFKRIVLFLLGNFCS
ncbi:hypothetical protein HMPREF1409_01653 [Helicobacter pylori GAM246Ai]|nr:hypothetical protein HMPREF1409_01653 [Helicobacter pylori GAM246Ai]